MMNEHLILIYHKIETHLSVYFLLLLIFSWPYYLVVESCIDIQ